MSKCPNCNVRYEEVETDFKYGDIILRKVKALRCPKCSQKLFTPEQYQAISAKIGAKSKSTSKKKKNIKKV